MAAPAGKAMTDGDVTGRGDAIACTMESARVTLLDPMLLIWQMRDGRHGSFWPDRTTCPACLEHVAAHIVMAHVRAESR